MKAVATQAFVGKLLAHQSALAMAAVQDPESWTSIYDLPCELPKSEDPAVLLKALLRKMAEATCEKRAPCHFLGHWQIYLHGLLTTLVVFPETIQFEAYRDEFLDTKGFDAGKSGR